MKALIVEKEKIKNNLQKIKQYVMQDEKKVKIIAVVKGNGYGLDIWQYAQFLADNGIEIFAVSTVEEAVKLRQSGISQKILMLSSTAIEEEIQTLVENDIIISIGSKEAGEAAEKIAAEKNIKIKAHLKIDTGFGRYGFLYNEVQQMVENIKKWHNIKIEGTFSHFSIAFFAKKDGYTREQYKRFMGCVKILKENDIDTGMLHICNSSAMLKFPEMHLNAVRVGTALLGRVLVPNTIGLKKVGYLASNVAEIKVLPKGYNIGYSNSYKTKKEIKVAVVPCGYADGYNMIADKDMFRKIDKLRYIVRDVKNAFKKQSLKVTINDEQCEVLGRLGMYHVTVDITGKKVNINDEVRFNVNPIYVNSSIERKYV